MKKVSKLLMILLTLCTVCALTTVAAAADDKIINPELIFNPQTTLNVFVDGEADDALTGNYPWGEEAIISAPAVSEKTFQYWTNAEGTVISYDPNLTLKMYSNTTVKAEYGASQADSETVAAFLYVTRTDGEIIFNAIASSGNAGIRYSTTKQTLDDLKGEDGVTVAPADETPNWALVITPENEDTTYYALAYTTVGTETTYSEVKAVKLSELQNGISMVTNLGDLDLSTLNAEFCVVSFDPNGGEGMMAPQGVVKGEATVLNTNSFTREGYTFSGWSSNKNGGGTTYTDGQSVAFTADTTLYAQWRSNSSGGNPGGGGNTTYAPTVSETKNGTVTVSPTSPKAGDKVTVTPKPDEGYEVDAVTVTDASGKAVEVTKNADGTYSFTQPARKVTISATFKKIADPDANCPMKAFTDLDPKAWYHDGIHWALENGVMNGVGGGKFDPNGTTTRGMIVTILYRLEGSPAVTAANPFDDVAAGQWYTDAVIWAAENKIVSGYGDGKFGPDDPITREQLAAILYRYAQTKGEGFKGLWSFKLDFPDAGDVSDWATEAVSWMVMNGIINGKDGKLVPGGNATRAEAATMLQRFCEFLAK